MTIREIAVKANGGIHLTISLATLGTLLWLAVTMGRKWERWEAHYKDDWCRGHQAEWVNATRDMNPAWKPASVWAVSKE